MDQTKPKLGISWFGLRRPETDRDIAEIEHWLETFEEQVEQEKREQDRELRELERKLQWLKAEAASRNEAIDRLIALKLDMMDSEGFRPADDDTTGGEGNGLRLGDRLVAAGLITVRQLNEAMDRQRRIGGRLGDRLLEMNAVTKEQIEAASDLPAHKGRLGEMLVESGAITKEQLDEALAFQRRSGGMLGDILMSLRMIEPDKLYRFVATQNNLGRIGTEFSFGNAAKLPEETARRYNAVVVHQDKTRCLVAVGAPLQEPQLLDIETQVGMPVEQVLATREELEYFWKEIYKSELLVESTRKLVQEQPQNSAHVTFTKPQLALLAVFGAALLVCIGLNALRTLIVLNIVVQLFYFAMTLFKFMIILYGTRENAQICITPEEIELIDERTLPVYTILVPMYKESEVIPQLLDNIEKLDYPKAKLDVRLLIEEDDIEAQRMLEEMKLPPYYTTIVVPDSLPKTKPKACNYGLIRARGEYVVIFDAEDRPDPDQLKKVHAAFLRSPDHCSCIQAKLNYFNSGQNMLTRWFTQEYSMWFELLLPGVMQLDIPIPLGGTSNHFKMSVLKEVNAWDPYNVTEDADLGIRLYKSGYTTAIVDSRTWEEANSRTGNWIRQRSRWIKGYMQTWLVHMRNPLRLWRELGTKGFLGFQVMVLATPMLPLLNPIYWLMLVLWYGWKLDVIPQFFPGIIYYFSALEFLLGNFLFVFTNIAGVYWVVRELELRRQYDFSYGLVKYALLTPIYWALMSIAAFKAAWQLVTKPFYWEKTVHGLTTGPAGPDTTKAAGGGM
ncbi:glycosyltransferase family 2 protein [Paenibacillus sp. GYB003]|uniref:glycosyltransferase family 2 protein n=1 Tax=Paenibacillus sp. GYB003 TaxID=2994392 RepID=UPI002F966479